jgi:hypothetical protein
MRRKIAFAIAAAFLISITAACDGAKSGLSKSASLFGAEDYVWQTEYYQLQSGVTQMLRPMLTDDTVYFFNEIMTEGSLDIKGSAATLPTLVLQLFSIKTDGTELRAIDGFTSTPLPENATLGSYFRLSAAAFADDKSIYIAETGNFGYYDRDHKWIDDIVSVVRKIDPATGNDALKIDFEAVRQEFPNFEVSHLIAATDGTLVVAGDYLRKETNRHSILFSLFDGEGNQKTVYELDAGNNGTLRDLILLPDGSPAALIVNGEGVNELRPIDVNTGEPGKSAGELPYRFENVVWSMKDGEYVSQLSGGLDCAKLGDTVGSELLTWLDCEIYSIQIDPIGIVGEDGVLCLSQIYDYAYNIILEFVVIKKVPKEEARKTVLTLACNAVTYNINLLTFQFNRYNPDYRIKILDYSKYNSRNDQTAGINMLNIDLSNGSIPDMLALDGLPYETYASKELFENLYPYIDADAELGGRDGVVPAILKASESPGGELYQISPEFDIRTVRANSKYAGLENSWSLDEFNAILKANPQMSLFGNSVSRYDILQQILQVSMDEFVNLKTGEVRFESPEFIQLIAFAKQFPDTANEDYFTVVDAEKSNIDSGEQLAGVAIINDVREFMWDLTLIGGNCVYKGFPCAGGNGSSFHLYKSLAMTKACSDKKGAWTFMRNILGTDHQREVAWDLPTNKQLFDERFEGLLAINYKVPIYDENGELIPPDLSEIGPYAIVDEFGGVLLPNGLAGHYTEDGKDIEIPYYTMTDEQYTRIMNFINSIDRLDQQNQYLSVIISEELAPFFAGQKDAESTAKIIQSRAQIYVSEQR